MIPLVVGIPSIGRSTSGKLLLTDTPDTENLQNAPSIPVYWVLWGWAGLNAAHPCFHGLSGMGGAFFPSPCISFLMPRDPLMDFRSPLNKCAEFYRDMGN